MSFIKSFAFCIGMMIFLLCVASPHGQAEDLTDFSFTSLVDGKTYSISDFCGNHLVIVFGSIYCRPCVGLLPIMRKYYEENKDRGIVVIGVDIDSSTEKKKVTAFVAEQKINFPFFIDSEHIARKHRVFMLPSVLFVDSDGKIIKKIIGPKSMSTYKKEMEKLRDKAVKTCRTTTP